MAELLRGDGIKLITLTAQASIILIVMSLGMSSSWSEATYLFRNPRLLLRSIVSRNVVIPLVAVLLLKIFPFHAAVAITIGVLAATPVPPILPISMLKAGGRECYTFGLLVSQAVLAIVMVPLILLAMREAFARNSDYATGPVTKLVFITVLLPFMAGIVIRKLFGEQARQAGRKLGRVGNILLIIAIIPMLFIAWTALHDLIGQGVLAGLTAMVIIGLLTGHTLGGPDEHDRKVLALATASAHPGIALGIAKANFPHHIKLVAGSIVIYLILRAILVIPYIRWRHRPTSPRGDIHAPARA